MNEKTSTMDIARSPDPAEEKKRALAELLPEAFSEGRVDVQALKRVLGEEDVIESGERYRLDWAGKSDAYKVLQMPTSATLRPQRDKSVNFDQAQHVFIEGENLEVLKVLQKAYFGKVKLIYIDPPYNTGNDSFIYPDRFQESKEDYLKRINELADDGTLMREGFFRKNSRESGHFHSNWLSMMLPRLYIARNLLRDDGVILISIDDNETADLKLLMDEIFGAENFVAQLIWEKGRKNDAKLVSVGHEYILLYLKNKNYMTNNGVTWREAKPGAAEIQAEYIRLRQKLGKDNNAIENGIKEFYEKLPKSHPSKKHSRYSRVDNNGVWRDDNMSWPGGEGPRYDVIHPVTGKPCVVPEGGWRYSTSEKMRQMIRDGKVIFREDHTEPPIRKTYLVRGNEDDEIDDTNDVGIQVAGSYFYRSGLPASNELAQLLGKKVFENPKDHDVLARWISYVGGAQKDDVVLDFFGGSGTTLQAVMELNNRDGGTRKSICVQLPEVCDEGTPAHKAGYRNLADIARDRIKQVISKLERAADLASPINSDLGFKSFALEPSNLRQWRGDSIDTVEQLADQMRMFVKSEKDGTATEDVLYELLLKFGQVLTTPVETLTIAKEQVFAIHERQMLFVLENFTEALIEPLLALKPREVVALDSVFHDSDQLKTNFDLQCRDAGVKFTCI